MSGPYRSLPVVNGPVCVDCMHSRLVGIHYHCIGGDRVVIRPARRDYVTGRDHPPDYRMVACSSKNGSGECLDFEAKEPIVDTRSRSSRLRDRLIRWFG